VKLSKKLEELRVGYLSKAGIEAWRKDALNLVAQTLARVFRRVSFDQP
jgi:hypothetical protein